MSGSSRHWWASTKRRYARSKQIPAPAQPRRGPSGNARPTNQREARAARGTPGFVFSHTSMHSPSLIILCFGVGGKERGCGEGQKIELFELRGKIGAGRHVPPGVRVREPRTQSATSRARPTQSREWGAPTTPLRSRTVNIHHHRECKWRGRRATGAPPELGGGL